MDNDREKRAAPPPKPRQPPLAEGEALRSRQWQAFIDDKITSALAPVLDAVGGALAHERKLARQRLEDEIAKLRAELRGEIDKRTLGDDRGGQIVDLPNPLRRRA